MSTTVHPTAAPTVHPKDVLLPYSMLSKVQQTSSPVSATSLPWMVVDSYAESVTSLFYRAAPNIPQQVATILSTLDAINLFPGEEINLTNIDSYSAQTSLSYVAGRIMRCIDDFKAKVKSCGKEGVNDEDALAMLRLAENVKRYPEKHGIEYELVWKKISKPYQQYLHHLAPHVDEPSQDHTYPNFLWTYADGTVLLLEESCFKVRHTPYYSDIKVTQRLYDLDLMPDASVQQQFLGVPDDPKEAYYMVIDPMNFPRINRDYFGRVNEFFDIAAPFERYKKAVKLDAKNRYLCQLSDLVKCYRGQLVSIFDLPSNMPVSIRKDASLQIVSKNRLLSDFGEMIVPKIRKIIQTQDPAKAGDELEKIVREIKEKILVKLVEPALKNGYLVLLEDKTKLQAFLMDQIKDFDFGEWLIKDQAVIMVEECLEQFVSGRLDAISRDIDANLSVERKWGINIIGYLDAYGRPCNRNNLFSFFNDRLIVDRGVSVPVYIEGSIEERHKQIVEPLRKEIREKLDKLKESQEEANRLKAELIFLEYLQQRRILTNDDIVTLTPKAQTAIRMVQQLDYSSPMVSEVARGEDATLDDLFKMNALSFVKANSELPKSSPDDFQSSFAFHIARENEFKISERFRTREIPSSHGLVDELKLYELEVHKRIEKVADKQIAMAKLLENLLYIFLIKHQNSQKTLQEQYESTYNLAVAYLHQIKDWLNQNVHDGLKKGDPWKTVGDHFMIAFGLPFLEKLASNLNRISEGASDRANLEDRLMLLRSCFNHTKTLPIAENARREHISGLNRSLNDAMHEHMLPKMRQKFVDSATRYLQVFKV